MTVPVDRRKAPRRVVDVSSDDAGEIKDILAGLVGMLTVHMTNEELEIAEIKHKIDTYFHELDAHTHVFHHSKVAEHIKEEDESHQFWSKVKGSALEKGIIFVSGVVAMYLVSLIWLDFGNKLAALPNPPQTIPAIVQPTPSQPKPPAAPNVPNHP